MKLGQTVYTKDLEGAHCSGLAVKEKYGHYSGVEQRAMSLTIRKASRPWHCSGPLCHKVIAKGELHGSTFYDHYCLDCVTETEPERVFTPDGTKR